MNVAHFNPVLKYLMNINRPVHASWIFSQLNNQGQNIKDLQKILNEFKKREMLVTELDFRNMETYLLNESTRELLQGMPPAFDDKPFDYIKDRLTSHYGQRKERWFIEVDELKQHMKGYTTTRRLAFSAFIIAFILLVLEVLKLIKVI